MNNLLHIAIIVAVSENNAIGRDGQLLCHIRADLKHFKQLTTGHTVIMGSKTWMSLPRRPLPDRRNIVLTRHPSAEMQGAETAANIEQALRMVQDENEVFVIGGGTIYEQMMPLAETLYVTRIHHRWDDADTFFPCISETEWGKECEETISGDEQAPFAYSFVTYRRKH